MQPLFAQNPLFLGVLVISCMLWRVLEAIVEIRQRKHLRASAQRQDKGSKVVLGLLIVLGLFLCVQLAFAVPITTITRDRVLLFWLGIVLFYVGLALRLYSLHVLGDFFTTTVAIAPEQPVMEAGPYRLIRHPSYTGFLITLLGFGLSFTNWFSLLALMVCALIGFSYRIYVEEHVLQEHLGRRYQEYVQRTKRLIPFVL